ncbi:Cgi121p Ecym_4116 [Eremothecium cymbalariae DBVPG|uniref:EKC/KEOPS complex subunit CGI121 n=1 Tax=Eremothecium cymbalariae (strain CBS 270.75 / DBVPG 7215 / KCTC 17166 / NRRL Y-17582) TaxID=931890 RepID=G8JT42_ERECY|nr:hypothetical protein Ecym_4116 [Eremothecium cymbalariae DBVPG\
MLDVHIPQFKDYKVQLAFFKDVVNVQDIRSKVAELPFGFIDARNVLSLEQLSSAVYKALIEVKYNKMRSKNLNSEVVLSLSPTSNIGDALRSFGIQEDSSVLILVRVASMDESSEERDFSSLIEGSEIELSDDNLRKYADIELIKRVCKKQLK